MNGENKALAETTKELSPAGMTVQTHQGDAMFFNPVLFEHAQRVAGMLSKSELVPRHFQNNLANCMIALNLAARMRIDVFGLMQSLYVVHGRPGVEGKLAIALINGSGRFSPIQYEIKQSGKLTQSNIPRWDSCRAYATTLRTGGKIEGPVVTWEMAVAEGWTKPKGSPGGPQQISKWQTLPDLMFSYRSAMFFCRVHCPELLIGLRTVDELDDIVEMVPAANGKFEKVAEKAPETAGAAPVPEVDPAIIKKFDKKVGKSINKEIFARFLEETARANNTTIDQVKAQVIESDSWETLLRFYTDFAAEAKKLTKATADTSLQGGEVKDDVYLAPGPCPNNPSNTYTREHCNSNCTDRPGCPLYED